MGTPIPVPLNRGEGTSPHHPSLRPVGPSLAGQASPLPLRQSGRGGLPALQDEQERGAYAPIALPGFCGGTTSMSPGCRIHRHQV